MTQRYFISIYLDTRRQKANGKYPVKLRVFTPSPRLQKMYSIGFELTKQEFHSVWETTKPRNCHKEMRVKLQAIEVKANKVAQTLNPFTFEDFEKKLYLKSGHEKDVFFLYESTIKELTSNRQIGTAASYEFSLKSIKLFLKHKKSKVPKRLFFHEITTNWLKGYENFMLYEQKRSPTTIAIYLRPLRAIFNKAIDEKEISNDYYPFGKRKYQIPSGRKVKKALTKEQLKVLYHAKPETPEQEKAKDFWFFSYSCNGMNMKDIALLRHKDIQDGKIEFYRAKTRLTSKTNSKPVTAYLNDFNENIINKYGNPTAPEALVFNILSEGLTPKEEQGRIKNFTRYVNQHLKKLCRANDLPETISTNWARHSFATNAVRSGASMEFIQESLGHGNLKTTQNYFAGFDSDAKKEFAKSLMNFDS